MRAQRTATLVGLLLALAPALAAQQQPPGAVTPPDFARAAGSYTITSVNGKALPAQTWTRQSSELSCNSTTQSGTLLLDSRGRWALHVTERDRCTGRSGRREILPDMSAISTGTYSVEGDSIRFQNAESGSTSVGALRENVITLAVTGTGDLDGQTVRYAARRVRSARTR